MPRYFFNLKCETRDVPDSTGAELRDPDAAWEAARVTARDLMQSQPDADVNWFSCSFEVIDGAGEVVFELPFAEAVEPTTQVH